MPVDAEISGKKFKKKQNLCITSEYLPAPLQKEKLATQWRDLTDSIFTK